MAIERIAVVGAGQMGSGIAQVAAQSGLTVTLLDASPDWPRRPTTSWAAPCQKLVEKGKITAEARQGILDRIHPADALEARRRRRPGHRGHRRAGWSPRWSSSGSSTRCSRPDAILASNTSSISITQLAAATKRPAPVHRDALHEPAAGDAAHRDHPRPADQRRHLEDRRRAGHEDASARPW